MWWLTIEGREGARNRTPAPRRGENRHRMLPLRPHDPFEHGHKPRTAYAWGEPVTRGLPEDGSHTPKARRTLRLHAPRGFPECRRQPPHARRRRPRPDTAALFDHHTPSRPVRDHRGDPRTYPPSNTRANTDTPACENWATSTRRSNKRLRSPPRRVSVVSGVRQSPTSGRPAIGRRNAVARKTTDSGRGDQDVGGQVRVPAQRPGNR